jgi:hypothetical protein
MIQEREKKRRSAGERDNWREGQEGRGMKKRGDGIRMKGRSTVARSIRGGGKGRERVQEMTM